MFRSADSILAKNRKNIFPFYHTVCDQVLPHIKHLYSVRNSNTFIKDLDTLCRYFEPVTLNHFLNSSKDRTKPVFHLTFDDGLRECSEVIQHVLLRKGIPATYFLNNDFIDNKALFYRFTASLILEKSGTGEIEKVLKENNITAANARTFILKADHNDKALLERIAAHLGIDINEYLNKQKPYLSSSEIKGLIKNGFNIGSHSNDHRDFSFMKTPEVVESVKASISDLNVRFGISCKSFSFPFTNHTLPVSLFDQLKNEIPECQFYFGTSGVKDDINGVFQRIPMEKYSCDAKNIIAVELRNYRHKKMLGRHVVKRK